jgi:hypothetical protein
MQADRFQQLMERLTHIPVIVDDEYGWHILRAHNDAPQLKETSLENVTAFVLSSPGKRPLKNAG